MRDAERTPEAAVPHPESLAYASDRIESGDRARDVWADALRRLVDATSETVDLEISRVMVRAGRFAEAERCYVFQFAPDHRSLVLTHEWAAPGSQSQSDALAHIDEDALPEFMSRLRAGEEIYVPDVRELDESDRLERVVLLAHGVVAILLVPMTYRGELIGFVGYDSCERERFWSDDHRATLRFVADMLAGVIGRTRLEGQNRLLSRALRQSPTGVVIYSTDGRAEWANGAFERITGHSLGQLSDRALAANPFGLRTAAALNEMLGVVFAGQTWSQRLDRTTADGRDVALHMTMFAVEDSDAAAGHIVALIDEIPVEEPVTESPGARAGEPQNLFELAGMNVDGTGPAASSPAPRPETTSEATEYPQFAAHAPRVGEPVPVAPADSGPTTPSDSTTAAAAPRTPRSRPAQPVAKLPGRAARSSRSAAKRPRSGRSDAPNRKLRVLVADGSDDSVRVVSAFLRSVADRIDSASDGLKVLELLKRRPYDIVLIDMHLPVMDGYATVDAIREMSDVECADTPVVALTAYALAEEIGRAIAAGCDGYLTKPIRRADLMRTVKKYSRLQPA